MTDELSESSRFNVRTTCPYCGVGCQLVLSGDSQKGSAVCVSSEAGCEPNHGSICVKGRLGMDFIGRHDRLVKPLIKEQGRFREVSWSVALARVTERFAELKARYGPRILAGLGSGKATNEDNYVMQKFVRAVFGTNNIDSCARLCIGAGLEKAFGSTAMTNSIEELRRASLVFVVGSNTTECHPIIGMQIQQAVASGKTELIVADPRAIPLSRTAEIYMRQRVGTDVALINAMMNVILAEGLHDRQFIEQRTHNFARVREVASEYTPERAATITSVPAEVIRRAARLYASAPSASIVYSAGITQHVSGTDNVLSLANLAMLTGNVGKPCTGANPLQGQSNVQGACDVGVLPDAFSGYQPVADGEVRSKFEQAWNAKLPDKPGLTATEIMQAASAGDVRGLYVMGENPMLSAPDLRQVREGLKSLDFLVVQDIFLTETAELADVVLPACAFAEKDGTFTNTERRVQRVRKALRPPGDARVDWRILCQVATRMGYPMRYSGATAIQNEIASLTPIYGGITYKRLKYGGLQWPCPSPNHKGTRFLHAGEFSCGKGTFHGVRYSPPKELPDDEYPFMLTTGRILQHAQTGTTTRRCDALNNLVPHAHLELNPQDAEVLGVETGNTVMVRSRRGQIEVPADLTDSVASGAVFLAVHFTEYPANSLTVAALDPVAKTPGFKACSVSVKKTEH